MTKWGWKSFVFFLEEKLENLIVPILSQSVGQIINNTKQVHLKYLNVVQIPEFPPFNYHESLDTALCLMNSTVNVHLSDQLPLLEKLAFVFLIIQQSHALWTICNKGFHVLSSGNSPLKLMLINLCEHFGILRYTKHTL